MKILFPLVLLLGAAVALFIGSVVARLMATVYFGLLLSV